ncbi:MAG TPA: hypothetical protein VIJ31_04785 [Acidothermaceae bacterium]
MARLTFPDEGSRWVYRTAGSGIQTAAQAACTVYLDSSATQLADIELPDSTPVVGSVLTVDAYSKIPLFLGPPSGADTLYVVVTGGPVTAIYARFDDRIDALPSSFTLRDTY